MSYARACCNAGVAALVWITGNLLVSPASAASFPLLSGTYIYTVDKLCQLPLTNDYKTSPAFPKGGTIMYLSNVLETGMSSTELELSAGKVVFTQGSGTPGKGSLSTTGSVAEGTAVLVHNSGGETGTIGAPLTIGSGSGTGSFSQTAATLLLPGSGTTPVTFAIYYGNSAGGIAQYALAFGNNGEGCAQRFTFTHT